MTSLQPGLQPEGCVATTTATAALMGPSRSAVLQRDFEEAEGPERDFYRPRRNSRAAIPAEAAKPRRSSRDASDWGGDSEQDRRMARFGNRDDDVHPRVPASAIAAYREMINAAAAAPAPPRVETVQRRPVQLSTARPQGHAPQQAAAHQ